jgi:hypothetical protein
MAATNGDNMSGNTTTSVKEFFPKKSWRSGTHTSASARRKAIVIVTIASNTEFPIFIRANLLLKIAAE